MENILYTVFNRHFKQSTWLTATLFVTPYEIYDMMRQLCPQIDMDNRVLDAWLIDNGYTFDVVDMNVFWLLEEVNN